MNVLFLSEIPFVPYIGGIQRVSEVLAVEMGRRGHGVTYAYYDNNEPDYGYKTPFKQYCLNKEMNIGVDEYNKILIDHNVDFVINQWPSAYTYYLLQHTPDTVKRVTVIHTQPFLAYKKERLIHLGEKPQNIREFINKWICVLFPFLVRYYTTRNQNNSYKEFISVSDRLCLLSKYFIGRILSIGDRLDKSKICSIPNPASFPMPEVTHKEKRAVFVARIENTPKNIFGFLDVWKLFSEQHSDWYADVVGDGPDLERAKSYCKKIGCKNVVFWGKRQDVVEFYKKAAIVCVTSYFEGWPMVLLESMTCGCVPVVFNTYEALEEIVDDDVNGMICSSACNPKEMASKMSMLADDENLLQQYSINAREKSQQFTAANVVNRWEAIYEELTKQSAN